VTGPVQVLVVGFERPSFSGEVLAELARLRDAGIVRLLDLLLVARAEDGTFETLDLPPEAGADFGDLAVELLGRPDGDAPGLTDGDSVPGAAWSLADAVPVGSTAAVALLEHVWAGPLREAIGRAGGVPLEETWLSAGDREALAALVAGRLEHPRTQEGS
jgi:hypothetical protein